MKDNKQDLIDDLRGVGEIELKGKKLKEIAEGLYNDFNRNFKDFDNETLKVYFNKTGKVEYYINNDYCVYHYLQNFSLEELNNWYEYIFEDDYPGDWPLKELLDDLFGGDEKSTFENILAKHSENAKKKLADKKERIEREKEDMIFRNTVNVANRSINDLKEITDDKIKELENLGYSVNITVDKDTQIITAKVHEKGCRLAQVICRARCRENDVFVETIGKALAVVRAYNVLSLNQLEEGQYGEYMQV